MISKAIQFATAAHENQTRKGSKAAYILHPLEAGIIVSQIIYDEEMICAAILHDTVEDAKIPLEALEEMFGKRVRDLVDAQSEDKTKAWQERKDHTVAYLNSDRAGWDVKVLALADKPSNIRSIRRDQNDPNMGENVWNKFNVKDKKLHANYYRGIVKGLADLEEIPQYREFRDLVGEVFG